ncbi:MAG: hypothetical protein ABIB61_01090 [Candidatus Shapirobacteria bacterium]
MAPRSELARLSLLERAPCRPGGRVFSEGQQESKEATCFCKDCSGGCCVDGGNYLVPHRLKSDLDFKDLTPEQQEAFDLRFPVKTTS